MSRRKKSFSFFLWHRRLGLAALTLVFILSITGIMLNHTEEFGLDETAIESDLILNWYNINPLGNPVNYNIDNIWISQWNQQLFFNGNVIYTHNDRLQGIVKINDIIAIALENFILLTDDNGELIELMSVGSQFTIKKIGTSNARILLLDLENNLHISDVDFTSWKDHSQTTVIWATEENLSDTKIKKLQLAFRGKGLSLEKVILDLHSGRIFNAKWGVYIMDASALIMMLLGISGIWVWWSRKLKTRKKRYYKKHQ